MVSKFYERNSKRILILAGLLFPVLYYHGETLPSNNDIETWLPSDSDVRRDYDAFKLDFGGEEVILVGISGDVTEPRLVEALRQRISRLDGIRTCWSPSRFRAVMQELTVADDEIDERLRGLVVSDDGSLRGLIAVLSQDGLSDRVGTVAQVREQVEYCQFPEDRVHVAGGPVVVAELDRLGNRKNNKKFFILTLLISLLLLVVTVKQWGLSFAILGSTIWAINLTLTLVKFSGMEMNFILSALPVMVMVFTLAISIHFVHYVRDCSGKSHPLDAAWQLAVRPCVLATITTAIGLASLHFNEMA
ncbi:MAG: MMPL family transporter, partial [Planctomycetota bacterium]|nr:MMPL family transporter [Planctomycetota bacterium]